MNHVRVSTSRLAWRHRVPEYRLNYQQLVADHAEIERLGKELIACTLEPEVPRPSRATNLLRQLSALIRRHLANEAPVLSGTLHAAVGQRHERVTRDIEVECRQVHQRWNAYAERWTTDRIHADWTGFAGDTQALLRNLEERLQYETSVLYSLALHYHVIAP